MEARVGQQPADPQHGGEDDEPADGDGHRSAEPVSGVSHKGSVPHGPTGIPRARIQ